MARVRSITGVNRVLSNMKAAQNRDARTISRILTQTGYLIQKTSQKIVPVDSGNLKASAYTRRMGLGFKSVVTVGYTAKYALYVHEQVGMRLKGLPRRGTRTDGTLRKGYYWSPQGSMAKFLEIPARNVTKFKAFQSVVNRETAKALQLHKK